MADARIVVARPDVRALNAQRLMAMVGGARLLMLTIAAAVLFSPGFSNRNEHTALLYIALGTWCVVGNNIVYAAMRRTSASNVPFASILTTLYHLCAVIESAVLFFGGVTYTMFFGGDGAVAAGVVVIPTSVFLLAMACTYTCTGHVLNTGASPQSAATAYRRGVFVVGRCVNGACAAAATASCLGTLFHCAMTTEARAVAAMALACVWLATDALTLDLARHVGDAAIDDNGRLSNVNVDDDDDDENGGNDGGIDRNDISFRRLNAGVLHTCVQTASFVKYVGLAIAFAASHAVRAQSGCAAMVNASAVGVAFIGTLLGFIGTLSAVTTATAVRNHRSVAHTHNALGRA